MFLARNNVLGKKDKWSVTAYVVQIFIKNLKGDSVLSVVIS